MSSQMLVYSNPDKVGDDWGYRTNESEQTVTVSVSVLTDLMERAGYLYAGKLLAADYDREPEKFIQLLKEWDAR